MAVTCLKVEEYPIAMAVQFLLLGYASRPVTSVWVCGFKCRSCSAPDAAD